MNNWLNNKPVETEKEITFAELKAEYQKGFQAGIDFAVKMIEERDLEPQGVNHVCKCGAECFGEAQGWNGDACPDCIKKSEQKYFQKTLNVSAPVKVGGFRI